MKHIREILAGRQLSLFAATHEKGSREWSAFSAVRDDKVGMFRVQIPKRPETRAGHSVIRRQTPNPFLRLKGAR